MSRDAAAAVTLMPIPNFALAGPERLTANAICQGGALAHLQRPCDACDIVKKIGLTSAGYMSVSAGLTRPVREGVVEDWPSRFNHSSV